MRLSNLKENEKDDSWLGIFKKIRKDNVTLRKKVVKYFFDIEDEIEKENLTIKNNDEKPSEIESKEAT